MTGSENLSPAPFSTGVGTHDPASGGRPDIRDGFGRKDQMQEERRSMVPIHVNDDCNAE